MQRRVFLSGAVVVATVLAASADARADRVHLVGGSVIEGKATRQGDKVIVEVESGELSLAADSVTKIESSDSVVQQFEKRYGKLAPNDVKGLFALADYCRDHEMRDHERELLQKVIEIEPDHKDARSRLGYVRTDSGWITREEQMRAQGMVQHEGQWVTREQLVQIERLEAEAAAATRDRDRAQLELELERKRVDVEKEKSETDAARVRAQQATVAQQQSPYGYGYSYPVYSTYSVYGSYPTYTHGWWAPNRCAAGRCPPASPPPSYTHPFPIAGVRDPASYFPR